MKHVKLYCKYTKLAGFKIFVERGKTWVDRTLWSLFYAITVPLMIFTIYNAYLQFMDNPFLTSVDAEYYPTYKLNFPGVSICSVNRISRESAMEIANEASKVNISRLSMEEIFEMISQLGNLYDTDFMMEKGIYRIDQLLSVLYEGHYDITDVMKRKENGLSVVLKKFQLTPKCSTMLTKCRFHAEDRNCSDVFMFRKTQYGFCCTFNYATIEDDFPAKSGIDHKLESIKVEHLGDDKGLEVVIDPQLDDYFYSIFPVTGWLVTIFSPHDYPDMTSGGVTDILLQGNMQMNVEVEAIRYYSTSDIKPYKDKRYCVFSEEMSALSASYTYSDCIVDCRVDDMWKICKCTPFYLPNQDSRRVCNLEDVPCLIKHRSKWFTLMPREENFNSESMKNTWALHCGHCYPECSDVSYDTHIATFKLNPGNYTNSIMEGVEIKDQSVLSVFFTRFGTISLRQDVLFRWYELLSDASGILGIFVGFSIIAVVEFSYFVGLFVLDLCKEVSSNKNTIQSERLPTQTTFLGELYPHAKSKATSNRYDLSRYKY